MKNIVYGGTGEEKQAAIDWLKAVADDGADANSTHAAIIQRILEFYVRTCGDVG